MSRPVFAVCALWIILTAVFGSWEATAADDTAILEVRGIGVEGRPPYDGGGIVRFDRITIPVEVVHYDGAEEFALPLAVEYEVLEPAPILLTSRMGTEYWRLYQYEDQTVTAVYTDEKIDLSSPGEHTAKTRLARCGAHCGPPPRPGLAALRGHYYFLIDRLEGDEYLDVVSPPPIFEMASTARELTFTLADLSEYELEIRSVESTWRPGDPLRVQVVVADAAGRVLPVVNLQGTVEIGDATMELTTEWGPLSEPTGWMVAEIPGRAAEDDPVRVEAAVRLETPRGIRAHQLERSFAWGTNRVAPEERTPGPRQVALPRDDSGVVRETRAIWASLGDISTPARIDRLVENCVKARLNVIVPDVFVRNRLYVKSDVMPWGDRPEGFDPLADLIAKAHAAGLEVHPWFCVSYRDPEFCDAFEKAYDEDVRMIDRDGAPQAYSADIMRPAYRKFMIELMTAVARDYDVDGIHLDYIRAKGKCYCAWCREEFEAAFGKPLAEATDDDWMRWRRPAVAEIVRKTSEGVRRLRPGATMSAAVLANLRGGAVEGQDPARWAREGWIDLIIPMDYAMQTLEVRARERQFIDLLEDDDRLVTGLSLYMRSGRNVSSRPPELMRQQIEEVRRLGIRGYCLFVHERLSDAQIRTLRNEVNAEPARPYFE